MLHNECKEQQASCNDQEAFWMKLGIEKRCAAS